MNADEIIKAILAGQLDESLTRITSAIRGRNEYRNQQKFYTLKKGDRVQFNRTCRPTYLAGATGTITEVRRTKVVVNLDEPCGRFKNGIITPVGIITRLASGERAV